MSLPHIQNSQAGRNHYDPIYSNLFEVYFTLPAALRDEFGADEAILTEHVLKVSGLEALDKSPATVDQRFMGTTRTYLQSKLDDTSFEITVDLSLNLRNGTDNYIYKLFKAWNKLGYDIATGETRLKQDYVADWLKVSIGNRRGDIFREVVFNDIMLTGLDIPGEFSYDSTEIQQVSIKFKSDWAKEINV